ncbi:transposase [Aneurinibacillus thermoaerophilus]|uniref:transposase n=1 Tax=Aneurinibacillus thermoaerophilus TaxID=143495 RepID=UPI002E20D91E|nr:transposase [Aneurinibacillus thermoaerophilus]
MLHNGLLRQISLNPDVVLFDSTTLRSSLYDKEARWGKSTRYGDYKGYKLHTVTTCKGIVLAYELTTVNVYDGAPVPYLFKKLCRYSIPFALGDSIYDTQKVQWHAQKFIAPPNPRNHPTRKEAFPPVIEEVLKMNWGRELYKLRSEIERVFASLKEKKGWSSRVGMDTNDIYFIVCVFLSIMRYVYANFATPSWWILGNYSKKC